MNFAFVRRPLFIGLIIVPNLISILYFGLIASPVYASRASLTVFNPASTASSLSSMLSGGAGDGSSEGALVFKDYAQSWDEFRKIDAQFGLLQHYSDGDLFGRYGGISSLFRSNDVALWHYYQSHVDVTVDVKSGIASVLVLGYQPGFTQAVARTLLNDAVRHLSVMNHQQQQDLIGAANTRKAALEAAIQEDNRALAAYRAKMGTYDPNAQYLSNLSLMNSLAAKRAEYQSQYEAVVAATPNSPDAKNLSVAISAMQSKMAGANRQIVANDRASSRYDALTAHRDNDIALFQQASVSAQQSEQRATQNRYYLDIISQPSSPRTPELPDRLLWIGSIALSTFLLWGLLR